MPPLRLRRVSGLEGRSNDVLYQPPAQPQTPRRAPHTLLYFGGDVQDYPEIMLAHRDNNHYLKWNLESTARMLARQYPTDNIIIVRPSRIEYRSFSCYDNFVRCNNAGVPNHTPTHQSLKHLERLLQGVTNRLKAMSRAELLKTWSSTQMEDIDIESSILHKTIIHHGQANADKQSNVAADKTTTVADQQGVNSVSTQGANSSTQGANSSTQGANSSTQGANSSAENSSHSKEGANVSTEDVNVSTIDGSKISGEAANGRKHAANVNTDAANINKAGANISIMGANSSTEGATNKVCATEVTSEATITSDPHPLWWRDQLSLESCPLTLVGFSKGCVVLNQMIYEFHYAKTLTPEDVHAMRFMERIVSMCWLDGGHAGGKNTWITSRSLLETLSRLDLDIFVHVSPYQVCDSGRPWIGREERAFTRLLKKFGARISRYLHSQPGAANSLQMHFDVLDNFKRVQESRAPSLPDSDDEDI